jgi:two-component system response regulator YesN
VDDEPVICQGLRYTIDWAELGIEVIGEAYDGEEALRLMERERADIVLTDIRMDGMDGLELASQLNQRFPDVRIIIISGYEDFQYARQAMRIGVHDYLLKPVEIDELVKTVARLIEDMRANEGHNGEGLQEIKLWLTNVARNGIAYGREAPSSLRGSQYRVAASRLERFQERYGELAREQLDDLREQWLTGVRQAAEQRPGLRSFSIFDQENLLITLIVADEPLQAAEWERFWKQAALQSRQSPAFYMGVSRLYTDLNETSSRCAEAANLTNYHVVEQEAVLDCHTELKWSEIRRPAELDLAQTVQTLSAALFKQNQEEMRAAVAGLFAFFKEQFYFLHEIASAREEVLTLLRQRLRKSGMTGLDGVITANAVDPSVLNTYDSLEQAVQEDMRKLYELVEQNGGDRSYWIIEKSKRYIEEHFTHELKASEVAAWLKITPSYFSYIFKQSTGKGFTEYVNELKMERAKLLLATTHDKVFEIADQVGYKEYKYFVSVFKSYMGMTPKQYRSMQAGNTETR